MYLTVISATIGIAIAGLCAWECHRLAAAKRRNVVLWTTAGLVFTVIALPVLVVLPAAAGDADGEAGSSARDLGDADHGPRPGEPTPPVSEGPSAKRGGARV